MKPLELGAGLCAAAFAVWLFVPDAPADQLTERQRAAIQQKIATEILHGQLLYGLPQVIPPAVEFAVREPRNAAESECDHYLISAGKPAWRVRVNERIAAQHHHSFYTETIPHEVAHLLRCQFEVNWTAHDARWETIVRDMGATPVAHHDYAGE